MRYALYGEEPTDLNGEADANLHTDPSPAGCQRTETDKTKVTKRKDNTKRNNDEELNEFFYKNRKTKKMTIYEYSTIYNLNRSLLKE